MNKNSFILLLIVLLQCTYTTVIPRVTPLQGHQPLTYKVSLDATPQDRWRQLVQDYKQPLDKFMKQFDMLPIPKAFFNGVQYFAKHIYKHQDFVSQVQAISKLSGYPFQKLFFINFMYQFSTFKACSALLVRTTQGQVLHGRNLDFQMWNLLSKLLVKVQYYKGGKHLFSVDTIVGSVFALTASKPGAFAINVDTRTAAQFSQDLVSVLVDNAIPTCWLIRKIMQEQTTFDAAVKRLKYTRIGAPVYYIVSGPGKDDGMVIERDVNSVHATYQLNDTTWFLLQTNYDRDYPDPVHDPRRIPVQKRLIQRGQQKFTPQVLLEEYMSIWPTLNIATIMSAIMSVKTGLHNTTAWYGHNPHNAGKLEVQ